MVAFTIRSLINKSNLQLSALRTVIRRQSFSPNTLKLAVLDSHGRDKDGRISSAGMSVLMFFDDVSSFIHYVGQTYLDTHTSEYLLPYQILFVHCTSSMTEEMEKDSKTV